MKFQHGLLCGSIAGFTTTFLMTPAELIKINMQKEKNYFKNFLTTINLIILENGI